MASPATVSRCGMVYNDWKDLGWDPFVKSWLQKHKDKRLTELLQSLFDKYVTKILNFRRKKCKELVPTSELNSVTSLCYLLDALATPENGVSMLFNSHYIQHYSALRLSAPLRLTQLILRTLVTCWNCGSCSVLSGLWEQEWMKTVARKWTT